MNTWGRTILWLGLVWLLTRWVGMGTFAVPDLRTAAIWAALLLALFLLWRDGRTLLARYGLSGHETPLAVLSRRLARGEIDLDSYRGLRDELLSAGGISAKTKNREPTKPPLRGDCR